MEFLHPGGLQWNETVVSKVQVTSTRMDQSDQLYGVSTGEN